MIKEPQLSAVAQHRYPLSIRAEVVLTLFVILFALLGLLATIQGFSTNDEKISYLTPSINTERNIS